MKNEITGIASRLYSHIKMSKEAASALVAVLGAAVIIFIICAVS